MNSSDIQSARDDLAYLRALVSGSGHMQAGVGESFMWAGIIYGLQCFAHWLQVVHVLPWEAPWGLLIAFGPTVLFMGILTWIIWKDRKAKASGVGARALGAVFQGAGLANMVMAFVFAYGSYKAQSATIWFYHPIVVCMFQAVAWFVAWNILRRAWLGFVSLGWFVTTAALGVLINEPPFVLVIGIALILLMAIPGYALTRAAKAQE
jgi:hypothetical protein